MATLLQIAGLLLFLVLWGVAWRRQPNLPLESFWVWQSQRWLQRSSGPSICAACQSGCRRFSFAVVRHFAALFLAFGLGFWDETARPKALLKTASSYEKLRCVPRRKQGDCFDTHLTGTSTPRRGSMPVLCGTYS